MAALGRLPRQAAAVRLPNRRGPGTADGTQGVPCGAAASYANNVQLLQLDSAKETRFGNRGLAHLFINPTAQQEQRFDHAYFYWDCC
jgi:uncharacterized protein YwqG